MECKKFSRQLHAYLDGELSLEDRQLFECHVQECPACRREVEQYRSLGTLLRESTIPDAPEDLTQRILAEAALRRSHGKAVRLAAQPATRWRFIEGAGMRAAAAVALVIGLTTGSLCGWSLLSNPSLAGGAPSVVESEMAQDLAALSDSAMEPLVAMYRPDNTVRR